MSKYIPACMAIYFLWLACISLADNKAHESNNQISQRSANVSNIVLSVSLTNKFVSGDVIYVHLSFVNQSDTNIYIPRGLTYIYDALDISVINAEGKNIPRSRFGSSISGSIQDRMRAGAIKLEAKEQISMDFNVSRLFDLTQAGEYLLSIRTYLSKTSGGGCFVIPLIVDKINFSVSSPPTDDIFSIEKHLKTHDKQWPD